MYTLIQKLQSLVSCTNHTNECIIQLISKAAGFNHVCFQSFRILSKEVLEHENKQLYTYSCVIVSSPQISTLFIQDSLKIKDLVN
jgi:hypothetical protein